MRVIRRGDPSRGRAGVVVEADGGSRGNPGPAGDGAVEQMSGRWKVKHPAMQPPAEEARGSVEEVGSVRFGWIPRARNARADAPADRTMDAQAAR